MNHPDGSNRREYDQRARRIKLRYLARRKVATTQALVDFFTPQQWGTTTTATAGTTVTYNQGTWGTARGNTR